MSETARINAGKECGQPDCGKPAKCRGLFNMHYSRLSRYGTLERSRTRRKTYTHTEGYIVEHAPGHRLANSSDEVFQHRRVFYDANGEGPFECFGCGKEVTWESMHIDHRDEVRTNNELSNLRASCPPCNTARGKTKISDIARKKSGLFWMGQAVTISDLARISGMSKPGIKSRLDRMSIDEAMSTPKVMPSDERPWRRKGNACDICGKPKSFGHNTYKHTKCAKIRQERYAREGKL